jgi:hypothetical protein
MDQGAIDRHDMIVRSRGGKIKVMLSINYNIYIIYIILLLYIIWIREGAMDDTSDGSGKSDRWYE